MRFFIFVLSVLFVVFTARSQTVTGPLTSTPNSIPYFVDAGGKKITNNPSLIYNPTSNVLELNLPAGASGGIVISSNGTPYIALSQDGSASFLGDMAFATLPANTIVYANGSSILAGLTNGAEGTVLGISNGVPAYISPGSGSVSGSGTANQLTKWLSTAVITNSLISDDGTSARVNGPLLVPSLVSSNSVTTGNLTVNSNAIFALTPTVNGAAVLTNVPITSTVTTLTWSTTNLAGMDLAAAKAFKVTLTNNAFLASSTFANLPTTAQYGEWTLLVLQDATGGWTINATNTVVRSAGGVFPGTLITTNASTISVLTFCTSVFTNGQILAGYPVTGIQ